MAWVMRGPPSLLKQPAAVDRGASWWRSTMRPRLERPIILVLLVWAASLAGWWGALAFAAWVRPWASGEAGWE